MPDAEQRAPAALRIEQRGVQHALVASLTAQHAPTCEHQRPVAEQLVMTELVGVAHRAAGVDEHHAVVDFVEHAHQQSGACAGAREIGDRDGRRQIIEAVADNVAEFHRVSFRARAALECKALSAA